MRTRGRPKHPETLTPRQAEVFSLLRKGMTNDEIAKKLGISIDGVKYHVSDILLRLGVNSRYEAQYIDVPPPSRQAGFLALFAFRRPSIGSLTMVACGACMIALIVVGAVLFARRLASEVPADSDSGTQPAIETGIPEIDSLLVLLQEQDVDGLVERVEFLPVACTTSDLQYQSPRCPPGTPEGAEVPAFLQAACEGQYVTSKADARRSLQSVFGRSDRSSIFAIGQGSLVKHADPYDVVVLTPGHRPIAGEPASLWYVTRAGGIVRFEAECTPYGAAQAVEARGLIRDDILLPPQVRCDQKRVSIPVVVVRVHRDFGPQIVAETIDASGAPIGERVIITAFGPDDLGFQVGRTPEAKVASFPTTYPQLDDIEPGTRFTIDGTTLRNCTIDAIALTLM